MLFAIAWGMKMLLLVLIIFSVSFFHFSLFSEVPEAEVAENLVSDVELAEKQDETEGECLVGCSLEADEEWISEPEIRKLLKRLSTESYNEESENLDTLLFFHEKVCQFREKHLLSELPAPWEKCLNEELPKDKIRIQLRVLTAGGIKEIRVDEIEPLSKAFHLKRDDLVEGHEMKISGRSRRVGLHHIWIRF
jgi:hypothetical protein